MNRFLHSIEIEIRFERMWKGLEICIYERSAGDRRGSVWRKSESIEPFPSVSKRVSNKIKLNEWKRKEFQRETGSRGSDFEMNIITRIFLPLRFSSGKKNI